MAKLANTGASTRSTVPLRYTFEEVSAAMRRIAERVR
jgi:hypothetical protein